MGKAMVISKIKKAWFFYCLFKGAGVTVDPNVDEKLNTGSPNKPYPTRKYDCALTLWYA